MKTTRQRLLNIVITMSVTINLVMLGGLGYITLLDNHVKNIYSTMHSPVVIYIPNNMQISGVKTLLKPSATQ